MIERLNEALGGRYAVEEELGAGGMATVFLADDLKHNRKVALKVLRPDLAAVVGAERFFSEIETTAQLQHPNILPLFDSGEADGLLFYAMPYVEGESLADRLQREKQLPVDQALDIARKVASALDYAHERGVVHRDVKPANILLSSGEPLVADFGIALAVTHAGDGRITETGLSLGTPHYMSPEQASGDRSLDPRSDVYALGCVLYEMLVGEPPFPGPTPQSVLARILTNPPNRVTSIRPTVAAHVDAAVARALEKLPADRFGSAAAFREALGDPSFTHTTAAVAAPVPVTAPSRRASPVATKVLAAGLVVATVAAALGWLWPEPPPPVYRFRIDLPIGADYGPDFVLSPDGSRLAYRGRDGSVHVRPLSSLEDQPIPGTGDAYAPFFSPDGSSLGVTLGQFGQLTMNTVTLNGSSPVAVGDRGLPIVPGGTWSDDGYIYHNLAGGGFPLVRVPSQGGASERLDVEAGLLWPDALPGGEALIVGRESGGASLGVLDLSTGEVRTIAGVTPSRFGRYAGGYLFWVSTDAILMAAPFDPERGELTGPSVALAQGLLLTGNLAGEMTVSDNGTLVYRQGVGDAQGVGETLGWVDRSGAITILDERLAADVGDFDFASLSPDGRFVAVEIQVGGDGADNEEHRIQVYDLEQGTLYQLTFEGSFNTTPRWMADGRVAYASDQGERPGIWAQPYDRSGTDELLFETPHEIGAYDTGPDPDAPLAVQLDPDSAGGLPQGIYAVAPSGGAEPRPIVATRFREWGPRISPDGRWVVYASDESGRPEIYVRAFPDGGRPYPISTEGGQAPAWAPGGDEILYESLNSELMLAEVRVDEGVSVRQRTRLFNSATLEIRDYASYDVGPEGRVLAVVERSGQMASDESSLVTVVLNVFEDIERRIRATAR